MEKGREENEVEEREEEGKQIRRKSCDGCA